MPKRELPLSRWIPYIIFGFVVLLAIALILPAIQQARESARRSTDKNNLKQLGLALHNYHDTFETLPPGGIFAEDGTAYHGWFTMSLPYIDSAPLYNWIDFDRPWTDPFNEYFFHLALPVALNPKLSMSFSNEGKGLIHYSSNVSLFHRNSSVTFDDVKSTEQTWMLINTFADWREWGSPSNWHDLDWPLEGSHSPNGWTGGGVHALFADGHVEMIAPNVDRSVLESYRSAARDVPEAKRTQVPLDATYRESGFERNDSGPLLPDEENSPSILTFGDKDGRLAALFTGVFSNHSDARAFTEEDLRRVLSHSADVSLLSVGVILNDRVAELLLTTTRLECLDVRFIKLSDEGIADLQKLDSLRILKGTVKSEMAAKLRSALPNCELRIDVLPY